MLSRKHLSLLITILGVPLVLPAMDGFDKVLFVKRFTYNSNHYYTEYLNSDWMPGGNLCALDLDSKEVVELVPELSGGVFGRFDLDFDSKHIVFAWKASLGEGYRLYEIEINPATGGRIGQLKQITSPPANEEALIRDYGIRKQGKDYHHGTDDMSPCYLPDGDIVFISTRCQTGTLCDAPDAFTTTNLYRINRDGSGIQQLTFGALSEATPTVMEDGRILYTRWEYIDKGAVSVKCLWAIRPDGSGSVEIYGNDISLPPTMIQARPIPGKSSRYVMMGTPHCPQNAVGTVIKLDMTKNIRTREPMTYVTANVDIKDEPGFDFFSNGEWTTDKTGKAGPLYRDPYPLSESKFLVSEKPAGLAWHHSTGYNLVWLDQDGKTQPLYSDPNISCFEPFPLKSRKRPSVLPSSTNPALAEKGLASCIVTDVYHGLSDIERGDIKYLRILEQVSRPWAARRRWDGDSYDQQHATISKDTHLGLKVQHGVVPVEEDGSAHFVVPANKNIFFQALDEHYMSVQTERTFVNYIPGETRSCIGCHETPNSVPENVSYKVPLALRKAPSVPGPQLGEIAGQRPLDYATDVQPVWDAHCIDCHGGDEPEGGLDLSGELTTMFSVSYEMLIESRRDANGRLLQEKHEPVLGREMEGPLLVGPTVGENHPKTGNVHYMPAKSFGSHNSVLVSMLAPDRVHLADLDDRERAAELAETHMDIQLSPEELLKVTNWVDTNAQFYGMYWGRKNLMHADHSNFRPTPTFKRAVSAVSLIPEEER